MRFLKVFEKIRRGALANTQLLHTRLRPAFFAL